MSRDTLLHVGTTDDSYRAAPERMARRYGLKYKAIGRDPSQVREELLRHLHGAAFVLIWNGMHDKTPLAHAYCQEQGVPHAFFEYGMLPQADTFFVDPDGFCGRSRLCKDLGWVTRDDMERLYRRRECLRVKHPESDTGDILVPMQIFMDTQVVYNTHYRKMEDYIDHLHAIFPRERLLIRPHPKGGVDYSRMGVRVDTHRPFLEACSKSHCVVGLTSTCLMEAAVYGKPVMAMGNCALRAHNPADHDRVAAGALALTVDRQSGCFGERLERFGVRPLGVA